MRKFGGTLLAIAIAVVGVIGLIAFFNSRDSSTAGGVIADAFKHTLTVVKPSDPRLQSFIERWLGQVASR